MSPQNLGKCGLVAQVFGRGQLAPVSLHGSAAGGKHLELNVPGSILDLLKLVTVEKKSIKMRLY